MMDFLIFNAADQAMFWRDDAESARWTVEDYSLIAEFPYSDDKPLERGQRIGFTDETGIFHPFEIRKVETMEPDHYQRITAEHIVVAELSDEHIYQAEITDLSISAALGQILDGTLWHVGEIGDSTVQSADISTGSVWQAVRTLEENYNVYITPRVTFDAAGITGRYLDIAPAGGVWRGVRLSLDKNADDVGIVYDDTELITAMYGYGKISDGKPTGFESVTWAETDDHPAKPAGQKYLEDPAATAAYGRNGRKRWGYYQNNSISDPAILLEKTWQALKQAGQPTISIECSVRDLYRMGYADQPIRLHDLALVDVEPVGAQVQLEITRLTVDLLDPTTTRPTIGTYIPNIIYINRQTAKAGGGGGGGGGRGQSNAEVEVSEFETEIAANNYEIKLRAYQRDMTNVETILKESGVAISAEGTIIYANNNLDDMKSAITTNADNIGLIVANGAVKASVIVGIVNGSAEISLTADKIKLNGETIANEINAIKGNFEQLTTGQAEASSIVSNILAGTTLTAKNTFVYRSDTIYKRTLKLGTVQSAEAMAAGGSTSVDFDHAHALTMDSSGHVTAGAAVAVGDSSATFDVAASAWFQGQKAAAISTGWDNAAAAVKPPSGGSTSSASITYPVSGGGTESKLLVLNDGYWSSGRRTVSLRDDGVAGTILAQTTISMPSSGTWSATGSVSPPSSAATVTANFTVNGQTYSKAFRWNGSSWA